MVSVPNGFIPSEKIQSDSFNPVLKPELRASGYLHVQHVCSHTHTQGDKHKLICAE